MIDSIVLLGFGGPAAPQEVRPFLDRVLDGRSVPTQRYEAVVEHYVQIGGCSPYNDLAERQRSALADELRNRDLTFPVHLALRNTEPFIRDVLTDLAKRGAKSLFLIPLAAYGGAASADRYIAAASETLTSMGDRAPRVRYASPFYDHPLFIQAHASRIRERLQKSGRQDADVPIVFTAHSVPSGAAVPYARQLDYTAARVAKAVNAPTWTLAYQSRSGAPNESWLEPDVRQVLRRLGERGVRDVLVAPIGFLCEHVEVLYDLDIDAAGVARDSRMTMLRAQALDDHPLFIAMLADLVERAFAESSRVTQ